MSHSKQLFSEGSLLKGKLSVHPRGFGFVRIHDSDLTTPEVFIPKSCISNAIQGDDVEICITGGDSPKGPEAKVLSVVERKHKVLAGHIVGKYQGSYLAISPFLGASQKILLKEDGQTRPLGQRLLMQIEKNSSNEDFILCSAGKVLGQLEDAKTDIPCAIAEFSLHDAFPEEVEKEAKAFGEIVSEESEEGREDLSELDCITIDPETAKDFDDALSLELLPSGEMILGVHIADVSHYVREGTALDREARKRCNSTYLPGFCLPMLPHSLSSHLCSLKALVLRKAVSVIMHFSPEGKMLSSRFTKSTIKSKKRFTYEEASEILAGEKESPFLDLLSRLLKLSQKLRKQRSERGSLELSFDEICILLNEDGEPTGTKRIPYDLTHQLVEEFMLKANQEVAKALTDRELPCAYRVHEAPSKENFRPFVALCRSLGFSISDLPQADEVRAILDQSPQKALISIAFIRSMRLAAYSPQNIGHYGLALTHYCHFTSPIRRYADLIIHRVLFGDKVSSLKEPCLACSEQERLSSKAENHVILLKKLRYLQKHLDQGRNLFLASITKVQSVGITCDLSDLGHDIFIHISRLSDDFLVYDEEQSLLVGKRSQFIYRMGDPIELILEKVDLLNWKTDWSTPDSSGKRKRRPKKRRKK